MSDSTSYKSTLADFVKDRLARLEQQEKDTKPEERGEVINDNLLFLRGAQDVLGKIGVPTDQSSPIAKAIVLLDARLDLEEDLRG